MKGVDAGDFGERIGPLFSQEADDAGLFAASKVEPSGREKVVAGVIERHRGRKNPIAIRAVGMVIGASERVVKEVVEQLVVTHRLRIGAVRTGEATGYYWIVDAEDLAAAVGPYRSQVLAMWRRLRVLSAPHEMRELLGQLTLGDKG